MQCEDQCSARCSDHQVEPLAGTAKKEKRLVVLEFPGGWSRDVLDGGTFGKELTEKISRKLSDAGAGLQLIRKPGRKGRSVSTLHVYVVDTRAATCVGTTISQVAEVLDLDLVGAESSPSFQPVTHPLLLVCTHAKRDACCAIKGRPLARELDDSFGGDIVWETSHMKGHRFAPTSLLLPWGYSFGRTSVADAARITERALYGMFSVQGNRGRGIYGPTGQVAELAVASLVGESQETLRWGDLSVVPAGEVESAAVGGGESVEAWERVEHEDGRTWVVGLACRRVDGVVASCGTLPKQGKVWEAVRVVETSEPRALDT